MSTTTNNNISEIFGQLDEILNKNTFQCYFPVLGTSYEFRRMSVAQHKELLGQLDVQKNNFNFFKTVYSILGQNAVTFPLSDIERLTLLDFVAFIIQNRAYSVSMDYFDQNNNHVALADIIKKLSIVPNFDVNQQSYEDASLFGGGISLNYSYPSIKKILFVENNVSIDYEDVKSITLSVFAECIKHIDSVVVSGKTFSLEGQSFQDRVKILDHLPTSIVSIFASKIYDQYAKHLDNILTLPSGEILPMNSLFFVVRKN